MNQEEPTTNIRRVGAKDRKKALEHVESLFPPEVSDAPEDTPPESPVRASVMRVKDDAERFPPVAPQAVPRRSSRKRRQRRRTRHPLLYNLLTLAFLVGAVGAVGYFAFLWQNPYSPLNPFPYPTPPPIIVTATPGAPIITDSARFAVAQGVLYGEAAGGCERRVIRGTTEGGDGYTARLSIDGTIQTASATEFEFVLSDAVASAVYTLEIVDGANMAVSEAVAVVISESCTLNLAFVRFVRE